VTQEEIALVREGYAVMDRHAEAVWAAFRRKVFVIHLSLRVITAMDGRLSEAA
jgi:hypothetical protein